MDLPLSVPAVRPDVGKTKQPLLDWIRREQRGNLPDFQRSPVVSASCSLHRILLVSLQY